MIPFIPALRQQLYLRLRHFDWDGGTRTLSAVMMTRIHGAGCRLMADIQKALALLGIQDDDMCYDVGINIALPFRIGGTLRYILVLSVKPSI